MIPRNFASSAVVVRYSLNPYLIVGKTTDALVAVANFTDASSSMQDEDTATTLVLNSFDTAANNDYLYIGSHIPFRGVRVIIGGANSNASVLTVKYRKSDGTWADISASDGTDSGGATFAQTGNVTWTLPTDWVTASLVATGDTSLPAIGAAKINIATEPTVYWTRWQVSAALDSAVTATGMLAMNRSTAYDEIMETEIDESRIATHQYLGTGCVEALTDTGTANLLIKIRTVGIGSKFA